MQIINKRKILLEVIELFEEEIIYNLYSYINSLKYGLNNTNIKIYINRDYKTNGIVDIVVQYYDGFQVYSKVKNLVSIAQLIMNVNPKMVSAKASIIKELSDYIVNGYDFEYGYVSKFESENIQLSSFQLIRANVKDVDKITKLLLKDENNMKNYTYKSLSNQIESRIVDNFGRNYLLYNNNEVIAHIGTYAEIDGIAVIGGVIVDEKHRNKGIGKEIVLEVCRLLCEEGKSPYLFVYNDIAKKIYEKAGFNKMNSWGKLVRQGGV